MISILKEEWATRVLRKTIVRLLISHIIAFHHWKENQSREAFLSDTILEDRER